MREPLSELTRLAVDTGRPLETLLHQYAMDGLVHRISAEPTGNELVLRGSLLTRLWSHPAYRPAVDVDYVAAYAYEPRRALATIVNACTNPAFEDELVFPARDIRHVETWGDTPFPGTRIQLPASIGPYVVRVQVDLGYDDPLIPPPVWIRYPGLLRGLSCDVLACRPELGLAWKVQGLFESARWRAKDLHDVFLISKHTHIDLQLFTESLKVAFASRGTCLSAPLRLFRGEFGMSQGSRLKWRKFRRERSDPSIPADLSEIATSVANFLRPAFEVLGVFDGLSLLERTSLSSRSQAGKGHAQS